MSFSNTDLFVFLAAILAGWVLIRFAPASLAALIALPFLKIVGVCCNPYLRTGYYLDRSQNLAERRLALLTFSFRRICLNGRFFFLSKKRDKLGQT